MVRRGVTALAFQILRHRGEAWMAAQLVAPQEGLDQCATHVADHKHVALEPNTAVLAAQGAGAEGGAELELTIYQAAATERLLREVEPDPARRLESLAQPTNKPIAHGRSWRPNSAPSV